MMLAKDPRLSSEPMNSARISFTPSWEAITLASRPSDPLMPPKGVSEEANRSPTYALPLRSAKPSIVSM